MHFIIALIVGGIIGWVASMVMNRDASMGIVANVIVGCLGSILGRFLLGFLGLGGGHLRDNAFDPMTLVSALVGAVVLLGIVNLVRRGSVR
ncbi:GlsB/YeaQ/YmgE family stress response membrane protein [Novosphingobium aquiterrae]|uniref:GlsB/YeaQ/YmgE family stress response membrane protein n=1 Tax=Novosphingobium aquiterrae TaxID=624388 RepID=A0ABV6PIS8_9SPHN